MLKTTDTDCRQSWLVRSEAPASNAGLPPSTCQQIHMPLSPEIRFHKGMEGC